MLSNIHKILAWSAVAAVKLAIIGAFLLFFSEHKETWWGGVGIFISLVSILWLVPDNEPGLSWETDWNNELEDMF